MDTNHNKSIRLTDSPSIAIVEAHQRQIGDRTVGRTLTRIVQAFHAAGLRLVPEDEPRPASPSPRAA